MAISASAAINNAATGSSTTLALSSVVMAAGDRILVAFRYNSTTATASLSDGVHTYNQVGAYVDDGTARQAWFEAINVAAGTRTITITFSASVAFRYGASVKVSGSDANASQAIVLTSNLAGNWTSAANNMTSGALTPTGQPNAVIGIGMTIYNARTMSAGSTYTSLGALSAWNTSNGDTSLMEWKRTTSTSSSPITYTLSGADGGYIWGIVVGEDTGGAAATSLVMPRRMARMSSQFR
jgi:hypothetical protein